MTDTSREAVEAMAEKCDCFELHEEAALLRALRDELDQAEQRGDALNAAIQYACHERDGYEHDNILWLRDWNEGDPEVMAELDRARATGYSPTSGGFGNLLGSLRTLGIIDYPSKGFVQLEDWVRK